MRIQSTTSSSSIVSVILLKYRGRIVLDRVIHLQQNADSQFLWQFLINFTCNMWCTSRECSRSCAFLAVQSDVLASVRRHDIGAHSYADNTQLYHQAPADLCAASASAVVSCIGELDRWMCSNWLKLNTDKTDFILLWTRQQIEKENVDTVQLGGSTFIYQLPSHAWKSSSTVSWCSQPTSSAWPDCASTSFISCALSIAPYQLRLHGCSSTPSSSAAWTIVTASSDPRVLFTSVPYSAL